MADLSPQEIEQHLSTLQPDQQNEFLSALPTADLKAYSDYSNTLRPNIPNPQSTSLPNSNAIVLRPGQKMEDLSNDELAQIAKSEGIEVNPKYVPQGDGGKGFLDTGMGMALGGIAKGVGGVAAAPLSLLTGSPEPEQAVSQLVDALGTRKPAGPVDRMIDAGFQGLGGAMAIPGIGAAMGAASPSTKMVADALMERPGFQAVSGVTSGLAGQGTAEAGGSPNEQLVASLIGGAAPGVLGTAKQAAMRGIIRGTDPSTMQRNIQTFQDAGTFPTVAQASGGHGANQLESTLSQFAPSSQILQDTLNNQRQGMADTLQSRADELSPQQNNSAVGSMIQTDAQKTIDDANAAHSAMYADFAKKFPPTNIVPATNTQQTLNDLIASIPGAKNLSTNETLNPAQSRMKQLLIDVSSDVKMNKGQGVPFQALQDARTKVGALIEESAFNKDAKTAPYRRLYGALSEDMKSALGEGTPAREAFDNNNSTIKSWHDQLDLVQPVLDKSGGPEQVAKAAIAGTKEGGTVLNGVYSMIQPQNRPAMTSYILNRALEDGNIGKFAKTYGKMNPEARDVMFAGIDPSYRKNVDAIMDTMGNLEDQRTKFGHAMTPAQAGGGNFIARQLFYAGTEAGAAGMAAGMGEGNLSHIGMALAGAQAAGATALHVGSQAVAKWMTNPKVVAYLAQGTKLPEAQIPIFINSMIQDGQRSGDPDLASAGQYLQSKLQQEQQ